jgi:predicted DNA binding CopG/RHH family protein
VQVIGAKVERNMKKRKTKYTDEPMEYKIIEDFLPSPKDLVLKEDNVKITITVSKKSLKFFKKEADKYDVGYQQMIRSLLDKYTEEFC